MNLTKIKTTDTKVHNRGNPKFTEIEDRNGTTFLYKLIVTTESGFLNASLGARETLIGKVFHSIDPMDHKQSSESHCDEGLS